MKQKISDTNTQISDGGRAKGYWAYRVMNPRYASQEDKKAEVDMPTLLKKYNLKGFEFGNWLSNNDRYDHIHAFENAFKSLEAIVGSKNLGMDMLLGVAFGARGMGGNAAAHYEPSYNMINLTKHSGCGALAHEWAHAIDFNLGKYMDQNKTYDALTGGRSVAKTLPKNTGAQLRYWANAVVDEIMLTESYDRLSIASEYWHRRTEVWARFVEQYICYECQKKKLPNSYLTHSWKYYTNAEPYLTEKDFLPIARGSMFSFMLVLKGVLNDKYTLTACPYKQVGKDVKKQKPVEKQKLKQPQAKKLKKQNKRAAGR